MRPMTGLLAVLAVAARLAAQEPDVVVRIEGADRRDWEAYFDYGVRVFAKFPREAGASFTWSSKLDPSRAEPLYGRWATAMMSLSLDEIVSYYRDEPALIERPAIRAADSLRLLAFKRNPFVHRGLDATMIDRFPGAFSDARDTRAWLAYSNGDFKRAIDLHTRSIEQRVRGAVWRRFDRALCYVSTGDLPAAEADLTALLDTLRAQENSDRIAPAYQSKHFLLYMIGRIQVQRGNLVAARESFGEALVEDAGFAYGHLGLASVSRAERKPAQAASEFALAIELAPDDGYLRYLHAQVLYDLNQFEGSAREARRAAEIEPEWGLPELLLGRIRERQNRVDEAFVHFERYVSLVPATDQMAKNLRIRIDARGRRSP
jgi:tetratricopeptide (TPR) repeat protein